MTYDLLLMLHFTGLALSVGSGFAMFTLARATRELDPPERGTFMQRAGALRMNGSIGLLLLIASGLGMLFERGVQLVFLRGGAAFHVKLTLVAIMIGVFGYSQMLFKKARRDPSMVGRAARIGPVMLLLGISIIISAVLAFH